MLLNICLVMWVGETLADLASCQMMHLESENLDKDLNISADGVG